MAHHGGDRAGGHHVFGVIVHGDSSQVFVRARREICTDTLLVDLRILGEAGEERVKTFLIKLRDGLCWEDARVFRQKFETIFQSRNCLFFILPVVFNSFERLIIHI